MFSAINVSAVQPLSSEIGAVEPNMAEIETAIQSRIQFLVNAVDPAPVSGLNPKLAGYKIVACGTGNKDTSAHRAKLANMITTANGGDGEMFALPCYVRYLFKYGHRMSTAEADAIKNALAAQTHELFGHGTLNHAAMQNTSYYLLAQYYPDVTWTDNSAGTWTSAQVMSTNKTNWARRSVRFLKNGSYAEVTSSTYSVVNFMCALNLYEFATDPDMRAMAAKELEMTIATLRLNSFDGSVIAPILRRNYEQLNAPDSPQTYTPSVGQHLLWLYYGQPSVTAYDLAGDKEPIFVAMAADSTWRPPAYTYRKVSGEFRLTIPSFSQWDGATYANLVGSNYKCEDFAIGCSNATFEPAGFTGWQTFSINYKTDSPQNQISCYHPYFDSNSGEDNWTSVNRWSPFVQSYRYNKSSVVTIVSIPDEDPWQYDSGNSYWMTRNNQGSSLFKLVQWRVPKNVDVFDSSDPEGKRVFIKAGKTMIAVFTLNGVNEFPTVPSISDRYHVIKVRQARTALFWRVESGTDFEDFKLRSEKMVPTFVMAPNPYVEVSEGDGAKSLVSFSIGKVDGIAGIKCAPTVLRNGKLVEVEQPLGVDAGFMKMGNGKNVVMPPMAPMTGY